MGYPRRPTMALPLPETIMPVVRLFAPADTLSQQQIANLQQRITDLMAEGLGKKASVTLVNVVPTDVRLWSVGGLPCGQDAPVAYLEAFITEGTNTPDEQAFFVQEAHRVLTEIIPNLASPAYVLVREVPAASWGYDGVTQEGRRNAAVAAG
jgi:4-oxalocrotonate tautomerase